MEQRIVFVVRVTIGLKVCPMHLHFVEQVKVVIGYGGSYILVCGFIHGHMLFHFFGVDRQLAVSTLGDVLYAVIVVHGERLLGDFFGAVITDNGGIL